MEELNEYYQQRERKNDELIVTMGYALVIAFGLGVLYLTGYLIVAGAAKIF